MHASPRISSVFRERKTELAKKSKVEKQAKEKKTKKDTVWETATLTNSPEELVESKLISGGENQVLGAAKVQTAASTGKVIYDYIKSFF